MNHQELAALKRACFQKSIKKVFSFFENSHQEIFYCFLKKFLALLLPLLILLPGCVHQLPSYQEPLPQTPIQKVRTTAYTHSEGGHHRYGALCALGTKLKCGAINSASADWARWPAGTRFRIKATGEVFIIDDYGFALAGTNTIDLYKPTRAAMNAWGVRRVTIEILEWGDPWRSYILLMKVKGYRHVNRMLKEVRNFFPHFSTSSKQVRNENVLKNTLNSR